ncbi:PhzF family phenazine biosynthesis protein [Streptomyces rubiginosohelvolus]|uniref:PhzF family phenazine biosynthesis protein n=1 Tax=Streptomyces rubiginosohelvolus TaxID=67362 RepID=UPI0036CA534D
MEYQLADVFTDVPLVGGNQLAVFTQRRPVPAEVMQAIALELNLSESVFLCPPEHGGDVRTRLFSTVREVDFAGHPLLGTAAVLAREREEDEALLHIETNVGTVPISIQRHSESRFTGWMDQPIPRVEEIPDEEAVRLLAVLGLEHSVLPVTRYDAGIPHLYVMAESPEAVRGVVPDFPALGAAAGDSRINVFAPTGPETAVTRMFSPYDRVPEDPACGSAAGPLAAHLVRHGRLASGTRISLDQGKAVNRPSTLHAEAVVHDGRIQSVRVGGGICLIGRGELHVPDSMVSGPLAGTSTVGVVRE